MDLVNIRLVIEVKTSHNLSDAKMSEMLDKLEQVGFLDKIYGAACSLCRETLGDDYNSVIVSLE